MLVSWERATLTTGGANMSTIPRPVRDLRVIDAMHPGMISCPPETPLRTVARMMATYRVHAIVVHAHGEEELPGGKHWGVVTDADLVRAVRDADVDEVTAEQMTASPVLTVATADPLDRAIQLMVEHEVSHLIAVERHSGRPIGVVSTLDVARAVAGVER
jgi:CBS domain-containing protein